MAKMNITRIVQDYLLEAGLKKVNRENIPEAFLSEWQRLQEGERVNGNQDEVYSFLNQSLESSLMAFGYTDYSLYLYCLKQLYYQDFEGSLIDVGCGNGLITCFIAKMNPDLRVVGIDRNENAIKVAEQLKEKLGLANVAFAKKSLEEVEESYDNVLSLRTVHENIGFLSSNIPYLDFGDQLVEYSRIYGFYGAGFARILNDGGRLLSIERNGYNTGYLAYLLSLGAAGLSIDEDSIEMAYIDEANSAGFFVKAEAIKEEAHQDILNIWLDHFDDIDDERQLRSYRDYELSKKSLGLIAGYGTFDEKGNQCAKRCLYMINDDKFILFQANNDIHSLREFPNSRLMEGKALLASTRSEDVKNGYEVKDYE